MRIIGNLDGTGKHYKVVGGRKIELNVTEKDVFMAATTATRVAITIF